MLIDSEELKERIKKEAQIWEHDNFSSYNPFEETLEIIAELENNRKCKKCDGKGQIPALWLGLPSYKDCDMCNNTGVKT